MLQAAKLQVKLFEMYSFRLFITALCVIFVMKLRWPRKGLYIVKSTLVSSGTTHIHPSMFSSVGLKIIPTKANDLIYEAVQVAIKKNAGGNIAVQFYEI